MDKCDLGGEVGQKKRLFHRRIAAADHDDGDGGGAGLHAVDRDRDHLHDARRAALLDEWAEILLAGAGVFVIAGATPDTAIIDTASQVFDQIFGQFVQSKISPKPIRNFDKVKNFGSYTDLETIFVKTDFFSLCSLVGTGL